MINQDVESENSSDTEFIDRTFQVRKHIFLKITEIKLQGFKRFWNVLGKVLFFLDSGKEAECPQYLQVSGHGTISITLDEVIFGNPCF